MDFETIEGRIGVDACRSGWFYVAIDRGELTHGVVSSLEQLIERFPGFVRICIDIPIGLPSKAVPMRRCEALARTKVGKRAPSVFSVPSRAAVFAPTIEESRRRNCADLGKSVSSQSFAICKKIAEVDHVLRRSFHLATRIVEVHPELCFWGLAGGTPLVHGKKVQAGFEERLNLLSQFLPQAKKIVEMALQVTLRKDVARDDVVDALVALVTACVPDSALLRITDEPSADECGLPMAMNCVAPDHAKWVASKLRGN